MVDFFSQRKGIHYITLSILYMQIIFPYGIMIMLPEKRKTFYKEINKIINYIQNKTEFYQVMVKLKLSSIFLEESIIIF